MEKATPVPVDNRRHDLDALRATAMLLGIALHAGLSFVRLTRRMHGDRHDPVLFSHPLDFEVDGVPFFEPLQELRLRNGKYHRHGHHETRNGLVLDPYLVALREDLADLSPAIEAIGGTEPDFLRAATGSVPLAVPRRMHDGLDHTLAVHEGGKRCPAIGSVIAEGTEYKITGTGKSGDSAKLTFASIDSIEKAGELRGVELFVPADSLPDNPDGVYYHYEILGVSVVTTDGRELGTLNEILETGSNDVFIVAPKRIEGEKKPAELLIPVLDGVIVSVDKETAIMTIDLPEGIL
ncbi:MAG: ribosome maturation factor RimM [Candidatus Poribacteria bacterium]